MKQLFYLLIIWSPMITIGQTDSSNYQFGIEFSARLSNAEIEYKDAEKELLSTDYVLAPIFNFTYNKHSILIGYDFISDKGVLFAGYRYNCVWPQNEKFSMFFPADLLFKSVKTTKTGDGTSIVDDKTYLKLNIGLGLKYDLSNRAYLMMQSGIGQYCILTNSTEMKYQVLMAKASDISMSTSLYFQIGIGYSFDK